MKSCNSLKQYQMIHNLPYISRLTVLKNSEYFPDRKHPKTYKAQPRGRRSQVIVISHPTLGALGDGVLQVKIGLAATKASRVGSLLLAVAEDHHRRPSPPGPLGRPR